MGEIERQHMKAPLAAAVSPLAISPNLHTPPHRELRTRALLFLYQTWVVSSKSFKLMRALRGFETGPTVYHPYPRRLESLTIFISIFIFLLSYLRTLSISPPRV